MWAEQKGFTIVELLIVIVVIGILAAVTIVAYGSMQNRASDAAVKADLRNYANKIMEYKVTNGAYPTGGGGSAPAAEAAVAEAAAAAAAATAVEAAAVAAEAARVPTLIA